MDIFEESERKIEINWFDELGFPLFVAAGISFFVWWVLVGFSLQKWSGVLGDFGAGLRLRPIAYLVWAGGMLASLALQMTSGSVRRYYYFISASLLLLSGPIVALMPEWFGNHGAFFLIMFFGVMSTSTAGLFLQAEASLPPPSTTKETLPSSPSHVATLATTQKQIPDVSEGGGDKSIRSDAPIRGKRSVYNMSATDAPIQVDPQAVTCCFLALPFLQEETGTDDLLNECLERCEPEFWAIVRQSPKELPKHLITSIGREVRAGDVILGLSERVSNIDEQSIVINVHEVSFDGGQTMTMINSGFCYTDRAPRIILPRNGGIIPSEPAIDSMDSKTSGTTNRVDNDTGDDWPPSLRVTGKKLAWGDQYRHRVNFEEFADADFALLMYGGPISVPAGANRTVFDRIEREVLEEIRSAPAFGDVSDQDIKYLTGMARMKIALSMAVMSDMDIGTTLMLVQQ